MIFFHAIIKNKSTFQILLRKCILNCFQYLCLLKKTITLVDYILNLFFSRLFQLYMFQYLTLI